MHFLTFLIFVFVNRIMCSYTSYSSVSQWLSAESSASYKWCKYIMDYTSGYSCTSSDTSTYWGGDSLYRCSTNTTYLPENSKKLLCPTDSSNWNTRCSLILIIEHEVYFNWMKNYAVLLIIINTLVYLYFSLFK